MSRSPAVLTQADVAGATKDGHTFIYFLRAGEFVKIGKSNRWKSRLSTMQTGSPYTIVPLLVLIDDQWFHMGQAITAFIKEKLSKCVAKSTGDDDLRIPSKWEDKVVL